MNAPAIHELARSVADALDGWHYDDARGRYADGELSFAAYLVRDTGDCSVCLQFVKHRVLVTSGAEWRDADGRWSEPYDREGIRATSAPQVLWVIRAIKRIEARAAADCEAAAKQTREHAAVRTREQANRAALLALGCVSRGNDRLIARNVRADAQLNLRVSGGYIRANDWYMTPAQAVAIAKFVLSDAFPGQEEELPEASS